MFHLQWRSLCLTFSNITPPCIFSLEHHTMHSVSFSNRVLFSLTMSRTDCFQLLHSLGNLQNWPSMLVILLVFCLAGTIVAAIPPPPQDLYWRCGAQHRDVDASHFLNPCVFYLYQCSLYIYWKNSLQMFFIPFLAHLSWKLKWAFLIAFCPSSVRPSVRPSDVCLLDFYIFNFFSRTAGPILTKVSTNHPYAKRIQNCTNEGQSPSPRGDNSERVKIYWKFLKIFSSRTSKPISIKLGTNHP
jgi:hypothetical protein